MVVVMNNSEIKYLVDLKKDIQTKTNEEAELNGKLKQLNSQMKDLGITDVKQLDKKREKINKEIEEIDDELEDIYESVKEKLN